jgi:hypothetical protein
MTGSRFNIKDGLTDVLSSGLNNIFARLDV